MARETRESERECMISLFQGAGFDRWEQVLHRLELTVYRSRYYRCIYCIEPATVRPLRTLLWTLQQFFMERKTQTQSRGTSLRTQKHERATHRVVSSSDCDLYVRPSTCTGSSFASCKSDAVTFSVKIVCNVVR
jgi:hypothetical protein